MSATNIILILSSGFMLWLALPAPGGRWFGLTAHGSLLFAMAFMVALWSVLSLAGVFP